MRRFCFWSWYLSQSWLPLATAPFARFVTDHYTLETFEGIKIISEARRTALCGKGRHGRATMVRGAGSRLGRRKVSALVGFEFLAAHRVVNCPRARRTEDLAQMSGFLPLVRRRSEAQAAHPSSCPAPARSCARQRSCRREKSLPRRSAPPTFADADGTAQLPRPFQGRCR